MRYQVNILRVWIGQVVLGMLLLFCGDVLCPDSAGAVNWLMLQGVEKKTAPIRLGGFILLDYINAGGGDLPAGPFTGTSLNSGVVTPNQRSSAEFNLRKLQLGIRGALTDKINYSLKTISGNNSASRIDDHNRIRLIESSVTLNHLPGARIRIGMFKTPAVEESLGFVPPCNYINLTNMTNMLMQERFFDADGSDPTDVNAPGVAGCCRDIGLMVFNTFNFKPWELTYAAMLANGHGLNLQDDNDNPDLYLYLAAERLRGVGKGTRRQGWKLFGWYQEGQRSLDVGINHTERVFRRCRYGVGTTLLWQNLRIESEIIKANGMIFAGTDGGAVSGTVSNNGLSVSGYNVLPEDQALGWYFDIGCEIVADFWLNARYDRLDLGTETSSEREFKTLSLGVLYRFSSTLRGKLTYEIRSGEAPHQNDSSVSNRVLDDLPNRFSAQLLYLF
ncbi:hypothetical protein [uncultured Desulfuromonas sp.]|uniref:hypothetical protein n=1 Tax=uncultured Desulfuromonas sp. TaxID=181013 RepID=UPI002AABDD31|nr:hypothetical protein [uncultured Desulfuromonas sp.]